jgi:hypothetical protein
MQSGISLCGARTFSVSRRLCLCLIGPDARRWGDKALCISIWRIGYLDRSDALSVIETPFGKVALLVDVDIVTRRCRRAAELAANC